MSDNTNERVETLLNEFKAQLDNEVKASEIIAKSADELVASTNEKMNNLEKAVATMEETISTLTTKLTNLAEAFAGVEIPTKEEIEKNIETKAEELAKTFNEKVEEIEKNAAQEVEVLEKKVEALENEPVIKTATIVDEEETVKVKEAPVLSRAEIINKALTELPTANAARKTDLFKAVSLLEAGASIESVKF